MVVRELKDWYPQYNKPLLISGPCSVETEEQLRNSVLPIIDKVDFELNDAQGGGALCKFLGAGPRQYDPTLLGTTFANSRETGRRNFSSIGAVTPKGAETSHVF